MMRCAGLAALFLWVSFAHGAALAETDDAAEANSRGAKLFQEGKTDAAIEEFQKALRLNSKLVAARLNLAFARERANQRDDAVREYRAAVQADPRNFFAHNNLGVLYDKKGMYDEAIAELQSALQSRPGDPLALKNLENARNNKAVVQELRQERNQAEKEAQARPDDPTASYRMARAHAASGNKYQAQEWLAKALKQGYKDLSSIDSDPAFRSMSEDRYFQLLLRRSQP